MSHENQKHYDEKVTSPPSIESSEKPSIGSRFLIVMAAFIIVIAGMRASESLMVPLLLSAFFAIISGPPLIFLEKKGVPTGLAILIVLLGLISIVAGVGTLIGTSLNDFSQELPEYQSRLNEQTKVLTKWLGEKGVEISHESLTKFFDPRAALKLVGNLLSGLGAVLSNTFLILLTVIFILLEAASFPAKLRAISGGASQSFNNLEKIVENIKHYMAIKTVISIGTGAIIALWLWFLGVDYPLLWGVLAFLLNYVPNIGSIIAAVPAVLLALIQLGPGKAVFSAVGFFVVNAVIGSVIEPKFMGKGLGLSTLVVFVSLVFWGWVIGPVGMLLSVPLTMTVKIALEGNEDTRWIAILLGSDVPENGLINESI